MKSTSNYLVTRPKLASLLMDRGVDCKQTVNPFNSTLKAWSVVIDRKSAEIIAEFYKGIGKSVPDSVSGVLSAPVADSDPFAGAGGIGGDSGNE